MPVTVDALTRFEQPRGPREVYETIAEGPRGVVLSDYSAYWTAGVAPPEGFGLNARLEVPERRNSGQKTSMEAQRIARSALSPDAIVAPPEA